MRLIVDIDNYIKEVPQSGKTIVLTNNTKLKGDIVFLFDKSCVDEKETTAHAINSLFQFLPSAFTPLKNAFYMRVLRPVFALIFQIEQLINTKHIDQLILNGGGEYPFITLYGGEGEGDNKWFRPSDLYNYFIYLYFRDELEVKWENKENTFLLNLKHRLREGVLSLKFVKRALVYLLNSNKKDSQTKDLKAYKIYAFVNTKVSMTNLLNLLPNGILNNVIFVKPSLLKVESHLQSINYSLKVSDYAKVMIKYYASKSKVRKGKTTLNLFNEAIEIKSDILLRALRYEYVQYWAEYLAINRRLERISFNKDDKFITNKTFGGGLTLVNNLSKKFNKPHYNFQSVAMSKMHYPIIDLADIYFMYTYESYQFYKNLGSGYKYYLPIFNTDNENTTTLKKEEQLRVTIFTQPDRYADYYLNFLKKLIKVYDQFNLDIAFIVKPHYRQNKLEEFRKITELNHFFTIESPASKPSDLIKKSDFIMSMTSSVIFEAFQFNCPTIVLSIAKDDEKFIASNCMPDVNYVISSLSDIVKLFNDPVQSKRCYFDKRTKYISGSPAVDYIKYLKS